jgi:prepilin-type N-terminal cleavage/methylation domain-containing protein
VVARELLRRRGLGFSLIETLVVLAIISILLLMLTTALVKAVRMAKSTAAGEEMRQDRIGRHAREIHEGPNKPKAESVRQSARLSFRVVPKAGVQKITSQILFVVRNDVEFRAYYHTLLNPANSQAVELTRGGKLIALTEGGERFELPPVGSESKGGAYPVRWEFISTRLSETGRGDAGGNVIYSDGHREYVPYPAKFPMTKSVALLSHEFVGNFHE